MILVGRRALWGRGAVLTLESRVPREEPPQSGPEHRRPPLPTAAGAWAAEIYRHIPVTVLQECGLEQNKGGHEQFEVLPRWGRWEHY